MDIDAKNLFHIIVLIDVSEIHKRHLHIQKFNYCLQARFDMALTSISTCIIDFPTITKLGIDAKLYRCRKTRTVKLQ